MTNVRFDDYIDSFSPSEKRDFIPKKYMTQKQIGLFRFGHPKKRSYHLMPLNLLQLHILFKMNTLSSILICPRKILILIMMCPLVHMKVKQVPAEDSNVLTLIPNLTHALRIQVNVSQSLVNMNQTMKHDMKSHTQTFQKLFKSLRMMSLMPQSQKDSTRKVT